MFSNKRSEALLAKIREGSPLTGGEKLRLIVELRIPTILAQITSVLMFYIDPARPGQVQTFSIGEWKDLKVPVLPSAK